MGKRGDKKVFDSKPPRDAYFFLDSLVVKSAGFFSLFCHNENGINDMA